LKEKKKKRQIKKANKPGRGGGRGRRGSTTKENQTELTLRSGRYKGGEKNLDKTKKWPGMARKKSRREVRG